ncbi:hypothetical protein KCP75_08930 [Salmonella enterica subsp. enterica]|nr:hypothetical protein KCP75_08930 [Salmonella enterica subsp. enterica]
MAKSTCEIGASPRGAEKEGFAIATIMYLRRWADAGGDIDRVRPFVKADWWKSRRAVPRLGDYPACLVANENYHHFRRAGACRSADFTTLYLPPRS